MEREISKFTKSLDISMSKLWEEFYFMKCKRECKFTLNQYINTPPISGVDDIIFREFKNKFQNIFRIYF